jgi:hypothetical protein
MNKGAGLLILMACAAAASFSCGDGSGAKDQDPDGPDTREPGISWVGEYHWLDSDSRGAWDLCGGGNRLYAAFSWVYGTAEALDITNPENPSPIAEIPTSYHPGRFHQAGGYLYRIDAALASAPDNAKLSTRDTSQASMPLTDSKDATGVDLCAAGGCLYVANAYGNTFSIYSLANPSVPAWVKDLTLAKSVKALAASGSTLYLADAETFRVYDISAPQSPVQVGSVALALAQSRLRVHGDYVYALTYTGVKTIDVSDAAHPAIVANPPAGNAPEDIFLLGDYLYVADNESGGGLIVDDISDPLAPRKAFAFALDLAHTLFVSGDYVYLGVHSSTGAASAPAGIKILKFVK